MSRRDSGSVTAELAVSLPALLVLFALGLGAVVKVADRFGCIARARDRALAVARGGDAGSFPGESIEIRGETVAVSVETRFNACRSVAAMEP
jgi:hypothetical protein